MSAPCLVLELPCQTTEIKLEKWPHKFITMKEGLNQKMITVNNYVDAIIISVSTKFHKKLWKGFSFAVGLINKWDVKIMN